MGAESVERGGRLFIGGLGGDVGEDKVRQLLSRVRDVTEVSEITLLADRDVRAEPGAQFAFATVKPSTALYGCVKAYNGCRWKGSSLRVQPAKRDGPFHLDMLSTPKGFVPKPWNVKAPDAVFKDEMADLSELKVSKKRGRGALMTLRPKSPILFSSDDEDEESGDFVVDYTPMPERVHPELRAPVVRKTAAIAQAPSDDGWNSDQETSHALALLRQISSDAKPEVTDPPSDVEMDGKAEHSASSEEMEVEDDSSSAPSQVNGQDEHSVVDVQAEIGAEHSSVVEAESASENDENVAEIQDEAQAETIGNDEELEGGDLVEAESVIDNEEGEEDTESRHEELDEDDLVEAESASEADIANSEASMDETQDNVSVESDGSVGTEEGSSQAEVLSDAEEQPTNMISSEDDTDSESEQAEENAEVVSSSEELEAEEELEELESGSIAEHDDEVSQNHDMEGEEVLRLRGGAASDSSDSSSSSSDSDSDSDSDDEDPSEKSSGTSKATLKRSLEGETNSSDKPESKVVKTSDEDQTNPEGKGKLRLLFESAMADKASTATFSLFGAPTSVEASEDNTASEDSPSLKLPAIQPQKVQKMPLTDILAAAYQTAASRWPSGFDSKFVRRDNAKEEWLQNRYGLTMMFKSKMRKARRQGLVASRDRGGEPSAVQQD